LPSGDRSTLAELIAGIVVHKDRLVVRSRFAHCAGNPQNFSLLRAAVNKITDKDHFPFWMPENTFNFRIPEFVEQSKQRISVTVNIANEIVVLRLHKLLCPND
jgi:hypothetical protein